MIVQVTISNCSIEHVYVIVQVTIFLLEKLDVLLLKTSEEEIQTDILPLIFNSLVSNNIQCQVKRTPKSGFSKSCSSTCFTGYAGMFIHFEHTIEAAITKSV